MDQNHPTVDQEIDLLELARKLWLRRKTFYKTCGIAVLVPSTKPAASPC